MRTSVTQTNITRAEPRTQAAGFGAKPDGSIITNGLREPYFPRRFHRRYERGSAGCWPTHAVWHSRSGGPGLTSDQAPEKHSMAHPPQPPLLQFHGGTGQLDIMVGPLGNQLAVALSKRRMKITEEMVKSGIIYCPSPRSMVCDNATVTMSFLSGTIKPVRS